MIRFVEKKYSRIPEEEKFLPPPEWSIPEKWKRYDKFLDVIPLGSYSQEFNTRTSDIWKEWRKDVKRVRKEISNGYTHDDRIPGTTLTHYYLSESEPGKRYYVSKKINGPDRLMYNIYAPELIYTNNEEDPIVYYKIELKFCIGHTHRKNSQKHDLGNRNIS